MIGSVFVFDWAVLENGGYRASFVSQLLFERSAPPPTLRPDLPKALNGHGRPVLRFLL